MVRARPEKQCVLQNGFDSTAAAAAPAAEAAPNGTISQQQSGDSTAYVDIPQALVGKVIGKGGETIKFVQNDTNTKVQIDHQTPGEQKRVTIQSFSGDQSAVEAAKAHIQRIITTDEPITGDIHQVVDCPQGIVGRVIGRGGETIRALQQASNAHIVVDQNYPEGQPRKVKVSGNREAVSTAVKMVTELIQGEPGSAQEIIQRVCIPLLEASSQPNADPFNHMHHSAVLYQELYTCDLCF